MRPIDPVRTRRIIARLKKSGDTPAADVLEQLLEFAQRLHLPRGAVLKGPAKSIARAYTAPRTTSKL